MKIVDLSPVERVANQVSAEVSQPRTDPTVSTPEPVSSDTSWLDSFWAGFSRDNTVTGSLRLAKKGVTMWDDENAPVDPSFNPYTYIRENWDKERTERLATLIDDGYFDDVVTPEAVDAYAKMAEDELTRNEEIDAHAGWGTAGALAGGILDPINLVPLGWAAKGRTAARVVKMMAGTALTQAANEAVLQSEQQFRSVKESLLNIGTAAALGGAFGVFAKAGLKGSNLHPTDADNVVAVHNLDTHGVDFRPIGDEGVDHIAPGDLSAAATPKLKLTRVGEDTTAGNIISTVGQKINAATITGRLKYSVSQASRKALVKLADTGGVLWSANKLGITTGRSAEDLKAFYERATKDRFVEVAGRAIIQTNKALGDMKAGKIAPSEFNSVMQRFLMETHTDADTEALVKQYGQQAAMMIQDNAKQLAEEVHRINDFVEKHMVERGIVRDEQRLSDLISEKQTLTEKRKTGTEQINAKRQEMRERYKEARKVAKTPEEKKALKDKEAEEIAALNKELEDLNYETNTDHLTKGIGEEYEKPKALGRGYGHAQLWNKSAVIRNRSKLVDMLIQKFATDPSEGWLYETFEMTKADLAKAATDDPELYKKVMRRWAGDEKLVQISRLEALQKSAQDSLKEAKLDLMSLLRFRGHIDRKVSSIRTSEARKIRDKIAAQRSVLRAKRKALKQERKALVTASLAGRQRALERQSMFTEQAPDVGSKELGDWSKAVDQKQKTEQSLGNLLSNWGKKGDFKRQDLLEAGLEKANQKVDDTAKAAFEDPLEAPKEKAPAPTAETAHTEGRLKEINDQLAKLDRELAEHEKDLAQISAAHDRVVERRKLFQQYQAELKDTVGEAAERLKMSTKDLRQVKSALRGAQKRTGLDEMIDAMVKHLADTGSMPMSTLDHIVPESGRFKARIEFTPEERRAFEDAGFLRRDVSNILDMQYRQVSGHIALREALDIGKKGRSWSDVIGEVENEYRELIEKNPTKAAELEQAMKSDIADINGLKSRLLGLDTMLDDPNNFFVWMSKKFRQVNFMRFGSGMLASALTDIGMAALRHNLIPTLYKYGRRSLMNAFKGLPPDEVGAIARSMELAHGNMSLARRLGDQDLFEQTGIGAEGTLAHTVTSTIDRAAMGVTEAVSRISGVPYWNVFWKTVAGYAMTDKLSKLVADFGNLRALAHGGDAAAQRKLADLASLGIGETEAARLDRFFKKFAQDDNGVIDPQTELWIKEPEGAEALKDYEIAIRRDQARTNLAVGIGDTPLLMDRAVWKTLLQFQTFNFVILNKYLNPLIQRGVHMKDARAVTSTVTLLASAALVSYVKAAQRYAQGTGEDPAEFFSPDNAGKAAAEIIDRSGILSYTSPVVDSLSKVLNVGGATRFQRNNAIENLLGPSYGLIRDSWVAGNSVVDGAKGDEDLDSVMKKVTILMPFGNLAKMAQNLATN